MRSLPQSATIRPVERPESAAETLERRSMGALAKASFVAADIRRRQAAAPAKKAKAAKKPAAVSYGQPLSAREREAINWLLKGETYKGAAARMKVGEDSVHTLIRRAYRKLGVHSRYELQSALKRRSNPRGRRL